MEFFWCEAGKWNTDVEWMNYKKYNEDKHLDNCGAEYRLADDKCIEVMAV